LANALYQMGDFEAAMKVAKELRAIKLDVKRPQSEGNAMLVWRAYNLPARLYIARGAKGDMEAALKSLPSKKELMPLVSHAKYPTLAGVFTEAISLYVGCRKAIEKKDFNAAIMIHRGAFRKQIMALAKVSKGASQVSDYSHYIRAGNCLSVFDMELAGLIALHGHEKTRVVAAGRFLSARDKQHAPSMMMPTVVMHLMENRLGDYYLSAEKLQDALDAYTDGERRVPNNLTSLLGMHTCLVALGQKDDAKKMQARIDQLKNS
jgi:tetratricopeptide (TPR) repeat protein